MGVKPPATTAETYLDRCFLPVVVWIGFSKDAFLRRGMVPSGNSRRKRGKGV